MELTRASTRSITLVVAAVIALAAVLAFAVPIALTDPQLTLEGPDDGTLIGGDDVTETVFRAVVDREDALDDLVVTLGGDDITDDAVREERSLTWTPEDLEDGEHELRVVLAGRVRDQEEVRAFTLDTTPPELTVDDPEGPIVGDEELVVTGTVDDTGAVVLVDGTQAERDGERFHATLDPAPPGPVEISATDEAGNLATDELVAARVPSRVQVDEIRSVHMTALAWSSDVLREPILEMARDGLINSVQLDLKEEDGYLGYDSEVPFAQEYGSGTTRYDLEEAVSTLHELGIHVIGRIVAFRDPVVSEAAWERDERDLVIQTADGDMYHGQYDGFTNFAHPDIRRYNIEVAVEAAEAGVDDILWDYIRRPEGPIDDYLFPGLETSAEEAIVAFTQEADEALAPYDIGHGISVYGIALSRPGQMAQDIEAMGEHVDYVAPMVYPSHWGPGEYGVPDPNAEPRRIVEESVREYVDTLAGTRTRVVPWLQDFNWPVTYTPEMVRAQIEGSEAAGAPEWIMWNASVRYQADALPPAPEGELDS